MTNKTPYERWQECTNDGHRLRGGWVSAKHTPLKEGEYDVRGHPAYSVLTWAHGHWWYMHMGGCGDIPYWHCEGEKRYAWHHERLRPASHIHWPDLLLKAVTLGSESAKAELCAMGWREDYNPYAGPGANRDWLHR